MNEEDWLHKTEYDTRMNVMKIDKMEKRIEALEDSINAIIGFIKFWDDQNPRILNRKEITSSDAFERSLSHFLRSKYNIK